jgi:hypothetical protein
VFWKDGTCNKALPFNETTVASQMVDFCVKKFSFYIQQNPTEVDNSKYRLYSYVEENEGIF